MPADIKEPQKLEQWKKSLDAVATGHDSDITVTRRNRQFVPSDIDNVATLLAQMFNEKEACAQLGLNYKSYANWKSRNKASEKIDEALIRAKAAQKGAHLKNIRDFETGKGGVRRDWRASECLLKIKFPEMFPQAGHASPQQTNVQVNVLVDTFKRLLPEPSPIKQIEAQSSQVVDIDNTK